MGRIPFYQHTQVGTGVLVTLAFSLMVLLVVASFTLYWLVPLYAIIVPLFGWLTVEINEQFLVCRLGVGLIRKRFALRDIENEKTVRNCWYYGWGIRWTPYGWLAGQRFWTGRSSAPNVWREKLLDRNRRVCAVAESYSTERSSQNLAAAKLRRFIERAIGLYGSGR